MVHRRYELIDLRVRRILEMGGRYLEDNVDRIIACQVIAPSES